MRTPPAALLTATFLMSTMLPSFLKAQCDKLDFKYDYVLNCFPAMVKLTVSGATEGSVYYWDLGKGYITGSGIQYEYIDREGVYSVALQVKQPDGTVCTKYKANLLDVRELGKPGFKANQTTFCSLPAEMELTDTTKGSVKRRWQIDGKWLPDTSRVLKYTFEGAGYHDIGLEAKSPSGCTSFNVKEKYITIDEEVKVDFCAMISHIGNGLPDSITLNALPPASVTSVKYIWETNTAAYTASEPYIKFSIQDIDSSDVTLTIITAEGCILKQTKQNLIKRYGYAGAREFCMRQKASFTWLGFGSGRSSDIEILSEPTSSITKKSEGVYELLFSDDGTADVRVKFRYNNSSCEDEVLFKDLYTLKPAKPEIAVKQTRLCKPGAVTFTTVPQFPVSVASYYWIIFDSLFSVVQNGGSSSFSYNFTKEGRYHVLLTVNHANGCTNDRLFRDAVVIGAPTPDFTFNTACAAETINFKNLTVPEGSSESLYLHQWTVKNKDSVQASFTSTDANPELKLNTPGVYDVTYEVSVLSGCSKKLTKQLVVNGIIASITNTKPTACLPSATVLKANVQFNIPAGPLTYFWEVLPAGNTAIVSQGQPTTELIIQQAGCYTVRLTVSNAAGCSIVVEKKNICGGVIASFSMVDKACPGKVNLAYNTSKANASSYTWMVSPSKNVVINPSASSVHANFTFGEQGDYLVSLVARSSNGDCTDTFKNLVKVRIPIAVFKAKDSVFYCAPANVRFSAYGSVASSYTWHWGDGSYTNTTDTIAHKVYTSNNELGYTVTLVAHSGPGCSDTFIRKNFIKISGPAPRFVMSQKKACGDVTIDFTDSSEFVSNFIMQYGDGSAAVTGLSGSHFYPFTDYSKDSVALVPTMFAVDKVGCFAAFRDTIVLHRPPIASFEIKTVSGCTPFNALFINSSAYGSQYEWDFDGDGVVDDQSFSPTFTYSKPGKYSVVLNVRNKHCSDVIRKEAVITVYDKPVVAITVSDDSVCYTKGINFTGELFDGSEINTWRWDFDDGLGSFPSGEHVLYKFVRPGQHKVRLIAMNYFGCEDTVYKNVFVMDSTPPAASEIRYVTPVNDKQFKIEWERSNNANFTGYELYQNEELIYSTGNIDELSHAFNLAGGVSDEVANYRLITLDPCGLEAKSIAHNNMVLNVKQRDELSLELTWNEYKGWDKTSTVYQLYRRKGKAKQFSLYKKITGDKTFFIDTPVCNEDYSYYLKAVSPEGYASLSNERGIRPQYTYQNSPLSLTNVTVEYDDSVRVSWNRSIQKNVLNYVIDRYRPDLGWQENYAVAKDTYFVDKGTEVDAMSYRYRVQVSDECGNLSPKSLPVSSILLQVEVKNDKRYLIWNAYKSWASGVEGYMIELLDNKGRYRVIGFNQPKDTFYTDDSLYDVASDGTCYRVTALQNAPAHVQEVCYSNTFCNDLEARVFAPTAFTPGNNDSLNKVWKVYSVSIARNFELKIFNRWGQEVYTSRSIEEGWNGTIGNKPAPAGEYIYFLCGQTVQGPVLRQEGKLILLR